MAIIQTHTHTVQGNIAEGERAKRALLVLAYVGMAEVNSLGETKIVCVYVSPKRFFFL